MKQRAQEHQCMLNRSKYETPAVDLAAGGAQNKEMSILNLE